MGYGTQFGKGNYGMGIKQISSNKRGWWKY
jgi:hypothetical protein